MGNAVLWGWAAKTNARLFNFDGVFDIPLRHRYNSGVAELIGTQ